MKRTAALVAAGLTALTGAASAGAATRIVTRPTLYPKYRAALHDYVSRCHTGHALRLTIRAPRSTRVTVGSAKARRGDVKATRHLRGGQGVDVTLAAQGRRSTYHVRCLPQHFVRWSARRRGRTQARFYLVTPTEGGKGSRYVVIFDDHGVPVWWKRAAYIPVDAKLLPDGNLAWARFGERPFATSPGAYEERRLDGKLVRRIGAVGINTDFHDLQVLKNGDHLVFGYVPRHERVDLSDYGGPKNALVLDGVVEEVSPKGKLLWRWSSKDHVATSESGPNMSRLLQVPVRLPDGRTAYDLVHMNSIEPAGGSVLISMAFTDAVYKVSRATGAVEWKLGGTDRAESLDVAGEPDGSFVFGSQHDARLLPDGTVSVFDNETETGSAPRAVRYRIDEPARTATRIEQVRDPQVTSSACCGGARRLPGGDWVVSWGYNPVVEELSPTGKVLFRLHFGDGLFSYRVVPLRAKQLSVRALRAGMNAMHRR